MSYQRIESKGSGIMVENTKKVDQEEVIELTEVVKEGDKLPLENNDQSGSQSDLNKEAKDIFSDHDQDTGQEKETLDLDSLFDELERNEATDTAYLRDRGNFGQGQDERGAEDETGDYLNEFYLEEQEEAETDRLYDDLEITSLPGAEKGKLAPKLQESIDELKRRVINLEQEISGDLSATFLGNKIDSLVQKKLSPEAIWQKIELNLNETLEAKINQKLENFQKEIQETITEKVDRNKNDLLKQEVQAIRQNKVSREELDKLNKQLQEELLVEIKKEIPSAAAKIIREEIKALHQELEEE